MFILKALIIQTRLGCVLAVAKITAMAQSLTLKYSYYYSGYTTYINSCYNAKYVW